MLTTINLDGKQCLAIVLGNDCMEDAERTRESLLDILEDVSMSQNAVDCMKSDTLYRILNLYRHMEPSSQCNGTSNTI